MQAPAIDRNHAACGRMDVLDPRHADDRDHRQNAETREGEKQHRKDHSERQGHALVYGANKCQVSIERNWSIGRGSNCWAASNISPFDLFGQSLNLFRYPLQMRINGERPPKCLERRLILPQILQNRTKAGERAKMPWLAHQNLPNVQKRLAILFLHIKDGGASIPGLDIVRLELDHRIQELDGEIEFFCVDRGLDP